MRIQRALILFVGVACAAVISAYALAGQKIHVKDAWSRATPPGVAVGVAYFVIDNMRTESDTLLGVSSPAAERAELHTHIKDGDIVKMRKLDGVEVGAGEQVEFKPGGHHVMLLNLNEVLKEGDALPLMLNFEKAGMVHIEAIVQHIGATEAEHQMDHSDMNQSNMDHSKHQSE